MRIVGGLLFAMLASLYPMGPGATAALSPGALAGVSVDARPNAQLPLGEHFIDENGAPRTLGDALGHLPAVLIFVDYTCRTLCGPILEFATAGLERSGFKPGVDYRLLVIGLDPKDGPTQARAMRDSHLSASSPVAVAAIMLIGAETAVHSVSVAAGYHYIYDAEHDQFAHPAAAYVITPEGRIARVLSGLGLDGNDLRLALVDAGEGRIGTFADHLRLLCYGFDPAQGIYTSSIERWLTVAAISTVIVLTGWLVLMIRTSQGTVS
jgi:protein SCO1